MATIRYENVAKAPDRLDENRLGWIWLDQFAQAGNLHIEAAIESFVLASARQFHKLVAGMRNFRVAGEYLQHREFAGRDGYLLVIASQCARREIEDIGSEL